MSPLAEALGDSTAAQYFAVTLMAAVVVVLVNEIMEAFNDEER